MAEAVIEDEGARVYGLVPFIELHEEIRKLGMSTVALSQLPQVRSQDMDP